jgi:hypothetical protein
MLATWGQKQDLFWLVDTGWLCRIVYRLTELETVRFWLFVDGLGSEVLQRDLVCVVDVEPPCGHVRVSCFVVST